MWTPELMERMMELVDLKIREFRTPADPKVLKCREPDLKRFYKYLRSLGAEPVEGIIPEDDHLGRTMAKIIDGEEPETDDQWKRRLDEHFQEIAQRTGKFPVPISFTYNKGFLLPNELAEKILLLGSFPPAQ